MLVPIRKLPETVKAIVAHKDCPDGKLSAYILSRCLPAAEVVFVQYGTKEHQALEPKPGMIFCDVTPVRERAGAFLEAGAWVLDHHDKQKDVTQRFVMAGLGMYADEHEEPGVSGAVLSWRLAAEMAPNGTTLSPVLSGLARLAGIRDTWMREHPDFEAASAQAGALFFLPWDAMRALEPPELAQALATLGPILREQKRYFVSETIRKGYRFEQHVASTKDRAVFARVFVMQGIETSDVAEALRQEDPPVDLCMGFEYFRDGETSKVRWSMRSRPGGPLKAADVAAFFGGGGHDHAAGFVMETDALMHKLSAAGRVPWTSYPPTLASDILETYVTRPGR